jgi:DNA processing protein
VSATRSPLGTAEVAAATLVCLPDMGPSRLRAVLDRWPDPAAALAAVRAGKAGDALPPGGRLVRDLERGELVQRWARAARALDLAPELARRGTAVVRDGHDDYPIGDDVPDRPAVLLVEGAAPDVLSRPRVAIVGTRSASVHGLADARDLGAFLARRGVTVVSGLAIGIDGAAHEGALDAGGGVVGVVATGLDVVYPRRHVVLYERVRRAGVLLSESGFGAGANRFRFPVRNRIIAALADILKGECAGC